MAEERLDKGRQGWGAGEPARVERGLGLNNTKGPWEIR